MSPKERQDICWENLPKQERMKYEIAEELGLLERVKEHGWKPLPATETGRKDSHEGLQGIYMKYLEEDLKTGNFKQMYLLFGEEAYLKNLYKNRLKNALVDPEDTINLNLYEGKTISIPAVIDQAETMPFFAEHRLIILENSGFFKNACPELADYLPQMPAETVLLFVENEVDKRGKLFKTVKSMGRAVELSHQNEKVLTNWVLRALQKEGKKITASQLGRNDEQPDH